MAGEKFTAGPWEMIVGTDEHGGESIVEVLSPYEPDGQFQVACLNGPWDGDGNASEECRANARLIAAAPALYEALKEAEQRLNHAAFVARNQEDADLFQATRDKARAALSQAQKE